MRYQIQAKETGDAIDIFDTLEEAEQKMEEYREEDIANGDYTPDFYEIEIIK